MGGPSRVSLLELTAGSHRRAQASLRGNARTWGLPHRLLHLGSHVPGSVSTGKVPVEEEGFVTELYSVPKGRCHTLQGSLHCSTHPTLQSVPLPMGDAWRQCREGGRHSCHVSVLSTGLFEVRAQEYLDTLPSGEHSGVNRFLKGLGKASTWCPSP